MQKFTTFLWFNEQAEAAVNFYVSLFKNSKITHVAGYGAAAPGPAGSVMMVDFELEGRQFQALNGGPQGKFTEAISLVVNAATQEEVNEFGKNLRLAERKAVAVG